MGALNHVNLYQDLGVRSMDMGRFLCGSSEVLYASYISPCLSLRIVPFYSYSACTISITAILGYIIPCCIIILDSRSVKDTRHLDFRWKMSFLYLQSVRQSGKFLPICQRYPERHRCGERLLFLFSFFFFFPSHEIAALNFCQRPCLQTFA